MLINHLTEELLSVTTFCKLKFADGKVMGFTDHDEYLNIDGIIYKSSSGFTESSILSKW